MNCAYHIRNPISLISIDPNQYYCQRKLCTECLDERKDDFKYIVSIKKIQEMVIKKLQESQINQTTEFTRQRMDFKSMLSQTENLLKNIWEELSESIREIYDMIEMEDKSYQKIISDDINPAELSNTDLEKLVQIIEGKKLDDWNAQKNSYLQKLEKTKNWQDQEIKVFHEKIKKEMKENLSFIKIQQFQQEGEVYEMKEDLFEILAQVKYIDGQLFKVIIEIMRKEKISDCLGFLSKDDIQKLYEQYIDKKDRLSDVKKNIKYIINVIRNIQEHHFNNIDYSTEIFLEIRQNLIQKGKEDEKIIEFFKFLVYLTAIDSKFIQCGSNALNILVEMKVDLTNQCFDNIRIKNTSLIGSNFVRCNLSGSEFDNIDFLGMNVNGAQLFNCKWKNIKIHELNNLDRHSD